MFHSHQRLRSCLAVSMFALGFAAPAALAQTPAQPPEASTTPDNTDVIIVTATRRETALEDTPQAISALNGEDQFDKGQTRLEDLSASVPNVNFAATSNTSQFYVRGIGNTFLNAGGDSGVAFYQDNAYVSDQTTTNVSLFDVERIEVLRGPQGALYGRNAVGGALHVISAEPTSTPEGRIAVTVGDYGRVEAEGYASGALGFADTDARISFQSKQHDGYIENQLAGEPGAPDAFNDLNSQALRVQTLTRIGNGELRLLAGYYSQSDAGDALAVTATPGIQYAVETLYGETPSTDPRSVTANLGQNDVKVYTGNAEYRQPLGDNDLAVTAAFRESQQFFRNDCDGTAIDNCRYVRRNGAKDYYLDAHLASPGDAQLQWLFGAVYQRFLINQMNDVTFPFPSSYLDPSNDPTTPVDMRVFSGGSVAVESAAAYLDLRYAFNDVWAVTGQIRYASTTKDALERLRIDTFAVDVNDLPNSIDETSTPFKIGIEGHLNSDLLVYANYATAYKDGAINLGAAQPSPVRPEGVKSYELGLKSTLLDGLLQFNGSAFHNDYEDLQLSRVVGTVVALVNVPTATIDGLELELAAYPIDGLEATLSYGYLDATLDEFSNSRVIPGLDSGPLEDLSGNDLPYVAKHTLNAGLSYTFSPFAGYNARFGGNYAYRSRIFFNEFNDDYNSQPSVGTLDLSGSISPDSDAWKAFFYIRNVTDETIRTGSTIYSGLIGAARAVSYAPPRHFGVGLSLSF